MKIECFHEAVRFMSGNFVPLQTVINGRIWLIESACVRGCMCGCQSQLISIVFGLCINQEKIAL